MQGAQGVSSSLNFLWVSSTFWISYSKGKVKTVAEKNFLIPHHCEYKIIAEQSCRSVLTCTAPTLALSVRI
jgi:hypothetical protein